MTRNRILQYAAIGAGAAVVLGIAVAAFVSLKVPFDTTPSAGPSTAPCEPLPCANVRGYIVWVSDLKIQEGLVTMKLTSRRSTTPLFTSLRTARSGPGPSSTMARASGR